MSLISRFRRWRQGGLAQNDVPRREPPLVARPPSNRPRVKSSMFDELLALLRVPRRTDRAADRVFNRTLKMAQPFPGVVPAGTAVMAADSQITSSLNFARGQGFGEDFGFFGFALLSELAQVPEYRRPSEILANEMTRKWIKLISISRSDKSEKIKVIDAELKRLGAQEVFRKGFEFDNFFGRGQVFIDMGVTDDTLKLPLVLGANVEKNSIKALRLIEPIWTYPNDYNCYDPTAANFYRPVTWWVLAREIHTSRMLTFVSRPVPDLLKPAYLFGGISLTQLLQPYVQNWLRTRQSVSNITHNFSTPVFKTDLGQLTEPGGAQLLYNRINVFNTARDNQGAMVVDHDKEDFVNVSAPLSGLDKLQAQAQEQMAAIAGIPLVKYFGITPSGLNTSSDGEIRAFYDTIESTQEREGTPQLRRLIDLIQMSKFGEVDPDIGFVWEPLWSLDEKGLAEVRKINAEVDCAYADHQIVDRIEIRKTIAGEENSRYASIDTDELPDLPENNDDGSDDDEPLGREGDDPDALDVPDTGLSDVGETRRDA